MHGPAIRLECNCGATIPCGHGEPIPDTCPSCGLPLVKPTERYSVFVAELACLMCGTESTLESAAWPPHPNEIPWHRTSGGPPVAVPVGQWRMLRCERCGGKLLVGGVSSQYRYRRVPMFDALQVRGRPSRALLERRAQEHRPAG